MSSGNNDMSEYTINNFLKVIVLTFSPWLIALLTNSSISIINNIVARKFFRWLPEKRKKSPRSTKLHYTDFLKLRLSLNKIFFGPKHDKNFARDSINILKPICKESTFNFAINLDPLFIHYLAKHLCQWDLQCRFCVS